MRIPDRVKALLTEDERVQVEAFEAGATHAVSIICPCCSEPIMVGLRVKASVVVKGAEFVPNPPPQKPAQVAKMTPEDKVITEADRTGVLAAFARATEDMPAASRPGNPRQFFLGWLKRIQITRVPADTLLAIRDGYGTTGHLEFWQANGITAVMEDRQLRAFIPTCLIKPVSIGAAVGSPMQGTFGSTSGVERWVRGRFGYVPAGASMFGEAMRQKSIGAFDAVGLRE